MKEAPTGLGKGPPTTTTGRSIRPDGGEAADPYTPASSDFDTCTACGLVTCRPLRRGLVVQERKHYEAGREALARLWRLAYLRWTGQCPEIQRQIEAARRSAS